MITKICITPILQYSSKDPMMQAANHLQRALKSGKTSFGGWQMLPGSNLSRSIARTPNLDWICVDTEHGNISDDSMHECVAAIAACGVSPIVRVPEGQHWMIKRALDAGAHGIMVPLTETVEQAKNVARFSKFPPMGNRGLGSPFSMEKFIQQGATGVKEWSQVEYFQQANESTVVCLQIETAGALQSIDEIAAVPGIDVLFIGPYDLGNSIGHPIVKADMDPELKQAISQIQEAAHKAGKWTAIFCGSGETARKYADEGFHMINIMTDVIAVKQSFAQAMDAAKGSYLHAGVQGIKAGVGKMTSGS